MKKEIYEEIFKYLTYSWYVLFIIAGLDLWDPAELYLAKITSYYQIFTALTLIYFFNPFMKTRMTKTHREMVFSAAIFILMSEGLEGIIEKIKQRSLNAIKGKKSTEPTEDVQPANSL